jgi:nucleoside-diphosphate-sugar epimerase
MLVAGATGYVGRNVVAEARRRGHDVLAHIRPGSAAGDRAAAEFAQLGARVVRTAWLPDAWHELLARETPDRLFLLLGTTATRAKAAAASGGPDASQGAIDLGLTVMAMTAAHTAAPQAGLIYLSSLGASAAGNEYLQVRATLEASLAAGSMPFTVVRPSFITGDDRGESRVGERVGATAVDACCAMLRLVGARRHAARLASITGPALARILVELAEQDPLDRRVHELDELRP